MTTLFDPLQVGELLLPNRILMAPLLEIVDQLIAVWGAGRVGVHLAPRSDVYDVGDSNPLALAGEADAVAFGKLFIANPDLPKRFALHAPLNEWKPGTFYTGGPEGYVDYLDVGSLRETHPAQEPV